MLGLVTMHQTILGKAVANVVCFDQMVEDAAELQEFADALRLTYSPNPVQDLSASWSLDYLTVAFLGQSSILYSVIQPFTLGALTGLSAGDPLPTNVAMLVRTIFTGIAPNRGRVYFTGLTELAQTNSAWLSTPGANFRDMVRGWATGIVTPNITYQLQILRRPSTVFPDYVANPVDTAQTASFPATQRRRRLGT